MLAMPTAAPLAQEIDGRQAGSASPADTAWHPSPSAAFRRSLVLPGWGQLYNRRRVKAVAYAGTFGLCVGMAVRNWQTAVGAEGPGSIFWTRSGWTTGRNNWLILGGFIYILAGVEAYVDAHLQTFDVSPIAMQLRPRDDGGLQLMVAVPCSERPAQAAHGSRCERLSPRP